MVYAKSLTLITCSVPGIYVSALWFWIEFISLPWERSHRLWIIGIFHKGVYLDRPLKVMALLSSAQGGKHINPKISKVNQRAACIACDMKYVIRDFLKNVVGVGSSISL